MLCVPTTIWSVEATNCFIVAGSTIQFVFMCIISSFGSFFPEVIAFTEIYELELNTLYYIESAIIAINTYTYMVVLYGHLAMREKENREKVTFYFLSFSLQKYLKKIHRLLDSCFILLFWYFRYYYFTLTFSLSPFDIFNFLRPRGTDEITHKKRKVFRTKFFCIDF